MGALIVADVNDDLSDLTLTQARFMAAADDMPVLPPGPLRIAIVVDASDSVGEYLPSRIIALENARSYLQVMFDAGAEQALVLFFRGKDEFGDLGWFTNPETAAQAIAGIEHKAGFTQHQKWQKYLLDKIGKQPVHLVIPFSDAVEPRGRGNPNGDDLVELCKNAMRLRRGGCRMAWAYPGTIPNGCPIDRAGPHAEARIREMCGDNDGVPLNVTARDFLDRLRAALTEAVLRARGNVEGAQKLLPHLQAVPFDPVALGEAVPVGRCTSESADGGDPS
jgi:hypothetical protein